MQLPLSQARFLKSELTRKAIADRRVRELTRTVAMLERQLHDSGQENFALQNQIAYQKQLLDVAKQEAALTVADTKATEKSRKRRATKKTISFAFLFLIIGIAAGSTL